ncbi:tRNA (adenosine(37)-N6)-threonylcarbamoyltransferase complex dimerization subunit type 1 TsaB [Palleronia sp. KMU-117]|uniref:tRNA (adenosine(37)-N6)-threonylcarbamoyltransferase complex dimerization subunit type 1 TsaB n=1 Tax=Palleronia sp. KMU-117 TaxID=3434108 RepID=UPI003D7507EC
MGDRPSFLVAFDTSAAHCAAAVVLDGAIAATRFEEMGRGQAERLMPLLDEMLRAEGLAWAEIAGIGVGIGPGNFTGTRISVATARGLALALGIPAVGISAFEIMREGTEDAGALPPQVVSVEAPRGLAYVQTFRDGRADGAPQVIDPDAVSQMPGLTAGAVVVGFRAAEIARALGVDHRAGGAEGVPARLAHAAHRAFARGIDPATRPAPLYVRPADAAPARDAPPVILPSGIGPWAIPK